MLEVLESRIAPASIVTFTDSDGDPVTVEVKGPGTATVTLVGGAIDNAEIELIELVGTDLKSKLLVSTPNNAAAFVGAITTTGVNQHLGTIDLFPGITIGNGVDDGLADVRVTGKLNEMFMVFVQAYTIFRIGEDLPYDVPGETKTPDTYNNRPDVTMIFINGPGVEINVVGDGNPQGVGGGGLGDAFFGSWSSPGFIRTTQSIDSIKSSNGDFLPTLEVDKFHVGADTVAGIGKMKINNGGWGSSGSEIEGAVGSFDATAFLAGATLTAASLGKTKIGGDFEGTITLTDPDSPALPSFDVLTDFTGTIISAGSIKKLKVKGDFKGSLQAPLIGAISAYSFLGTTDLAGDPTTFIRATTGSLGTITSTAGPISDFTIETGLSLKGVKVSLGKLDKDTIAIDNVNITAASIGNIAVSLKAAKTATDLDLIGIRNSHFVTTGTGTTKTTAGNIGKVSVSIGGVAGGTSATGILDSTFDALVGDIGMSTSTINALGDLSVKISGHAGATVGIQNASFAGNSIGKTAVSVSRGTNGTAQGINNADLTATGAVGAITVGGDATMTLVDGLKVWAGGDVGGLKIASKDKVNGTLANSAILAGQLLVLDANSTTKQLSKLGDVSVSGSLTGTDLVSYGTIGKITVGKDLTDSLILAGAKLGGDFLIDGDEEYQRAASIASLTVNGAFGQTSVIAGVNPGDGIFGNGNDVAATAIGQLINPSLIGKITLAVGTTGTPTGTEQFGIEAAAIGGLKVAGVAITAFPLLVEDALVALV